MGGGIKKIFTVILMGSFLLNSSFGWAAGNLSPETRLTRPAFQATYQVGYTLLAHKAVNDFINEYIHSEVPHKQDGKVDITKLTHRIVTVDIDQGKQEIIILPIPDLLKNTGQIGHVGSGAWNGNPAVYVDSKFYYNEKAIQHELDKYDADVNIAAAVQENASEEYFIACRNKLLDGLLDKNEQAMIEVISKIKTIPGSKIVYVAPDRYRGLEKLNVASLGLKGIHVGRPGKYFVERLGFTEEEIAEIDPEVFGRIGESEQPQIHEAEYPLRGIARVAWETASNLTRHAPGGFLIIRYKMEGGRKYLEICGVDAGRKIEDMRTDKGLDAMWKKINEGSYTGGGVGLAVMKKSDYHKIISSENGVGNIVISGFQLPQAQDPEEYFIDIRDQLWKALLDKNDELLKESLVRLRAIPGIKVAYMNPVRPSEIWNPSVRGLVDRILRPSGANEEFARRLGFTDEEIAAIGPEVFGEIGESNDPLVRHYEYPLHGVGRVLSEMGSNISRYSKGGFLIIRYRFKDGKKYLEICGVDRGKDIEVEEDPALALAKAYVEYMDHITGMADHGTGVGLSTMESADYHEIIPSGTSGGNIVISGFRLPSFPKNADVSDSPANCLEAIKNDHWLFTESRRGRGITAGDIADKGGIVGSGLDRTMAVLQTLGVLAQVPKRDTHRYKLSDMLISADPNYTKTLINAINDMRYHIDGFDDDRVMLGESIPEEKNGAINELVKMTVLKQTALMQEPVIAPDKVLWHIIDNDLVSVTQANDLAHKVNKASRDSSASERVWVLKNNESVQEAMTKIKAFCPEAVYDVAVNDTAALAEIPESDSGVPIKMLVFEGAVGDISQVGGIVAALRALHLEGSDVMASLLRIYAVLNGASYKGDVPSLELLQNSPKEFARRFIFTLPPVNSLPVDDITQLNDRLLEILMAA